MVSSPADPRPSTPEPLRGARGLFGRWVVAFTVGELLGFGVVPAVGGFLAWFATQSMPAEIRSVLLYLMSIAGGLAEGSVLAWFQARVLKSALPALDSRRWIVYTALAAAFAWALGMLAPTLDDLIGLPTAVHVAIWVAVSVPILLSIGFAQSRVLASVVEHPRSWLWANVLGWLLGLPWTFVMPALVPEHAPPAVFVTVMVMSGVLMGVTAGVVTGRRLVLLVRA